MFRRWGRTCLALSFALAAGACEPTTTIDGPGFEVPLPLPKPSPGPLIEVKGRSILVDGRVEAALDESRERWRIDALFTTMKNRRVRGDCTVRAPPTSERDPTALTRIARSVAYGGCERLTIEPSAGRGATLRVQVAGELEHFSGRRDESFRLELRLGTSAVLTWARGEVEERTTEVGDHELRRALCEEWREHGEHRAPEDAQRDRLIVFLRDDPSAPLLEAVRAITECQRHVRSSSGDLDVVEAFDATLFVW